MSKLFYKGKVFDDFREETDPELSKFWSQVCEEHKEGLDHELDEIGFGICGIEGCSNISLHYVDFKEKEVEVK